MSIVTTKRAVILLIVCLSGAAVALLWYSHTSFPWEQAPEQNPQSREFLARRAQLEAREQEADRTVWAKEMLAENCGRTIEALWDSANASSNKLEVLATFPVREVVIPEWGPIQNLAHGIELREGKAPGPTLSSAQWRTWVEEFGRAGWQLENLEFRQNQFDTDAKGDPGRSHFYFAANLTKAAGPERASLEGDLVVDWAPKTPGQSSPAVKRADASHLSIKSRVGEPFFKSILQETITPPERSSVIDPLIVYDLDGDGLPEIILVARNLIYHRASGDHYEAQPLCRHPLEFITTALVADFDGDGFADLLCATSRGLFLFKGSGQRTFDEPALQVWSANPPLKDAMVLTCGDVDENGTLDVFLAQYRVPTLGQVLRPFYYDANDGWPAYLLRNDGHGNFTDMTQSAGLASKRWRRTYSASLVDLDGDGHLDLAVVSDFAGLDLYRNNGHGQFANVTGQWTSEPHAFGMALAAADFNADGRLDLLMIGMPSPTVDRLEHLNLHRPYSTEDPLRRPAMTYGNRLFIARTNGGFDQTALSDSIARSGWSWGCSAFDFDNDGFPDVYIANGLESNKSVKDYESEFWLHNIFLDESIDNLSASHYLINRAANTRGSGWSYGGYERNRLFLNRKGKSFTDIGHLGGVGLEEDSRNVVAADLDGDGRVDLVVTTFEVWPQPMQTLRVFRNCCADVGHWIGFRFHEQGRGVCPVGAKVTIYYDGHSAVRQIVTGDSHRAQHPAMLHFGIGSCSHIDSVEIRWGDGQKINLLAPAVDKCHDVHLPVSGEE